MQQPELLADCSLEELRTLAIAYPFAHNLRYLLAVKAHAENHPDAGKLLQTASVFSIDRTRLYQMVVEGQFVPSAIKHPTTVMELKPVETVRRELEALQPEPRREKQSPAQAVPPLQVPDRPEEAEFRASFDRWFGQFNPPCVAPNPDPPVPALRSTAESREQVRQGKTTGVAQELAERSVTERDSVVSESLARLLAKQGHAERAVNMYRRLILVNPEKSDYFAAAIEKLKK
jgi:hypothetical protein